VEHKKLQVLAELLEEYRAECAAKGLRILALKAASVRNAAASDTVDRRRDAVVLITEGRPVESAETTKPVARQPLAIR